MSESWNSLTGKIPKGFSDVKDGLQKAIKNNCLIYRRDEDGDIKTLASRIWDAASCDPNRFIEVMDFALRKRTGMGYIFSCLNSPSEAKHAQSDPKPADIPPSPSDPIKPKDEQVNGRSGRDHGFVLIYRSLRRHPWFQGKPPWVKLFFINLCLDAAWKNHVVNWRSTTYSLKRGQVIILERKLAKEYEQSQQMVHYWIGKLVTAQMINTQRLIVKKGGNLSCGLSCDLSSGLSCGTLVTICKYDDYQTQKNDDLSCDLSSGLSCDLSETEQSNTEKGKENNGHMAAAVVKKITRQELFDIWEKEKGPLPEVFVREGQKVDALIDHLNGLIGKSPQEHWVTVIHKARQCHKSHYRYMCPAFFSKDLDHINQVLRGLYDHSFERTGYGQPTTFKRPGKGNAADFGRTDEPEAKRTQRLADAFKSTDV